MIGVTTLPLPEISHEYKLYASKCIFQFVLSFQLAIFVPIHFYVWIEIQIMQILWTKKKKYKISAFWMKRILSYNFVAPNRNFYQNEKLFFLPISKSNAFVPKTRNSNSNIHWRMLSFGTSAYFYVLMMCRAIDRNFFFVCDFLLCEWYVVTNYRQWHKHRHAMYDVRVSKRRRHH